MATRVAVRIRTALTEERRYALQNRKYSMDDVRTLMKAAKEVYAADMKNWKIMSVIIAAIFGALIIFLLTLGAPASILITLAIVPVLTILWTWFTSGTREKTWLKRDLSKGYPELMDTFEDTFKNL